MAVLSPDHHARHLSGDEEKAEFYRTAPIETPGYHDLADEVSRRPRPEAGRIAPRLEAVEATLDGRAIPERDEATRQAASKTMRQVIAASVRFGGGNG